MLQTPSLEVTATKPLTFWFSDLHDGTRVDHPSILLDLGHKVIMAGHKGSHTIAPWVFKRNGLQVQPSSGVSDLIKHHTSHSKQLDEQRVYEQFLQYARDGAQSSLMATVSAFVCSFPASLCEAYMAINRSIIWAPAHRYPLGRCSQDARNQLDLRMKMAFQRPAPAGWPPHFIAAMSEYDAEYVYHYLGRRPRLIEATSFGYIPRANGSQDQRREFLIGPLQMRCGSLHDCAPWLVNAHEEAASNFKFGTAKKLYGMYKLNDLRRHRAAIVLPYAVMSYGLTELYALRVPLFAPSRELAAQQQRWLFTDRMLTGPQYCRGKGYTPARHPSAPHPFSPEDDSTAARRYWLQFADVYRWPHVTYFSSFAELAAKIETANFSAIQEGMKQENVRRLRNVRAGWQEVADEVLRAGAPRDLPAAHSYSSFRKTLSDSYNT